MEINKSWIKTPINKVKTKTLKLNPQLFLFINIFYQIKNRKSHYYTTFATLRTIFVSNSVICFFEVQQALAAEQSSQTSFHPIRYMVSRE